MGIEESGKFDLTHLETEQPNPRTSDIDALDTFEILKRINDEDRLVPHAVAEALSEITEVVELCVSALQSGGRVVYVGAGTSGRIGFLDAVEVVPTFGVPEGTFVPLIAGGTEALVRSVEYVEDDEEAGASDLGKIGVGGSDVVIGVTASGRTPYVAGALRYARSVGAKTVLVCNVSNPRISNLADVTVRVVTGPEVVTGSTRMKAGSAQKMVLNMISTATMIKLGKVYGNYMVDVLVLNQKLQRRAVRIISEVTGVDEQVASEYLSLADNKPKLAIMMILTGATKEECECALERTPHLRKALGELSTRRSW